MAVIDHLRVASAELVKAAELVKQEIESLRTEETRRGQDLRNRIAELTRQLHSRESDLHRVDDPNQRAQIQQQIRSIELEIAQRRAEEAEMQRQVESAIRAKQGQVTKLESQSRGLAY